MAPQEGNPDARGEGLPYWVSYWVQPLPSTKCTQEHVPAGGDGRSGRAISAVPGKPGSTSALTYPISQYMSTSQFLCCGSLWKAPDNEGRGGTRPLPLAQECPPASEELKLVRVPGMGFKC